MSERPTKKEIRLVLWGVVFAILGQAIYDVANIGISPFLPPFLSALAKFLSALVAVGIFAFYLSRVKDGPTK